MLKEQQRQKQDFVRSFGPDPTFQNTLKNLCTLLDDYSAYRQTLPGASPVFDLNTRMLLQILFLTVISTTFPKRFTKTN